MAPRNELLSKLVFGGFGILLSIVGYFLVNRDGQVVRQIEEGARERSSIRLELETLRGTVQRNQAYVEWAQAQWDKCKCK